MTTKVRITNEGPSLIQVKLMNVYGDGLLLESKYRGPPLSAGQTEDYYAHKNQRLEIEELE